MLFRATQLTMGGVVAAMLGLTAAAPASYAQETITFWANKGFYKAEDDALNAVIDKFQKATGVKVDLSLYSIEDCITKSVGAIEAGTPPDAAYCLTYDFRTTGKWAWESKIEDLSDIVNPMKGDFVAEALATTLLANQKTGKKAYYALPIQRQTIHINYWRDMLEEAGFKESDIPTTWNEYWGFWCDKVQGGLRAKGKRVFGIGHPLSVEASDTFFSFLMVASAYGAQIVDESGKIVLDEPKNKAAMVEALKFYTSIHTRGCTPPGSVSWKDPDNNQAQHAKQTVMTHNATISIAAKWLDDSNNASLTQEQRDQAKENYEKKLATTSWPKGPNGQVIPNLAATKTAVVFADGKNKKRGREFLAFFVKDENLRPFTEGSLGRWYPATTAATKSAFWTSGDPHRAIVHKQFSEGTVPFQFVYNFKFTTVNAENVWGKAMNRILQDKVPAEQAVDEMIKRIKEIAG
jgi:multiple sugar transport system substrate-binding protein